MCVCKKIIILIIKRGNGGWVGNVYDSLLFVGLLLFVAHHIWKKYLVAKEWELSRRCKFKCCVGVDVVRLLVRMVIDQRHDSNSAGGSSGTKGGGCTYNCAKRNELIWILSPSSSSSSFYFQFCGMVIFLYQ